MCRYVCINAVYCSYRRHILKASKSCYKTNLLNEVLHGMLHGVLFRLIVCNAKPYYVIEHYTF